MFGEEGLYGRPSAWLDGQLVEIIGSHEATS